MTWRTDPNPRTSTQVLSAVGAGFFVPLWFFRTEGASLLPGFLCILSPGASLTYTIEATGTDIAATPLGFDESTVPTIPVDNASGLTATYAGTLTGGVMAIRPRITSYTSGTLTFQFCQPGSASRDAA